MSRKSTIPPIPKVPDNASPELRKFLSAVKESIEVRAGVRDTNNPARFVTLDELTNFDSLQQLNKLGFTYERLTASDSSIIGPPTNFVATNGVWCSLLTWTDPSDPDNKLSHIEVWRSTSNSRSNAILVAAVPKGQGEHRDYVPDVNQNYYYWVRAITWGGKYSVWAPPDAQGGAVVIGPDTVGETIDSVMGVLRGGPPPTYSASTTYYVGDKVSYVSGGSTRSYECISGSGIVGIAPTNTTYWEQLGFLVEGPVNGVNTVAVDGNLVVDGSILARHILADQITATHISAGAVTAGKISVGTLSAISANIGTVTAGVIRSSNYNATNKTGFQVDLTNAAIVSYQSGGITLKQGSDIILESIDSSSGGIADRGAFRFNTGTSGKYINFAGSAYTNTITVFPETNINQPRFYVGQSWDQSDARFYGITLAASSGINFWVNPTTGNLIAYRSVISMSANTSGTNYAQIDIKAAINYTVDAGIYLVSTQNYSRILIEAEQVYPYLSGTYFGTSTNPWDRVYTNNIYRKNEYSFDVMDDLEILDKMGQGAIPENESGLMLANKGLYPEFLTDKDSLRQKIKAENGVLITDGEIETALNDPTDMGALISVNDARYQGLLSGAVRQQYRLYKALVARIERLEGLNGRTKN